MDWLEMSDGARILLRRGGNPDGPRLLVSHGNGLAVDAFAGLCRALAGTCELILFDLRNHGRNPPHDLACHSWQRCRDDFLEINAALRALYGARPVFGLFHSIAGLTALRVAAAAPGAYAGLVLMEPPHLMPPGHPLHGAQRAAQDALVARTLRRKEAFDSPEELLARLAGRPEFSRFPPGAIADYVHAILRENAAGRWTLACPRAYEAKIFQSNCDAGLYDRLSGIETPVLIVAGASGIAAGMAREAACRGGFDVLTLHRAGHLMPLEQPRLIAAITRAMIEDWQH